MSTAPWVVSTSQRRDVALAYRPILDLARGVVAGYQTLVADADRSTAPPVGDALAAASSLPPNTFLTVPLALGPEGLGADDTDVLDRFLARGDLAGIVLDLLDVSEDVDTRTMERLTTLREAGALVALGGDGVPQPALRSIIRLRPSIVRLGRAWVDGIEHSAEKRDAIQVTGSMAGQLDAWVLAEGVGSAAELRTLSDLGVPLAQGPVVGPARPAWQGARPQAHEALPQDQARPGDGVLRHLVRRAYTTEDLESARTVLPETRGYDVVVVVDEHRRPTSLLVKVEDDRWESAEALTVHVDTPVGQAVGRAMGRPRSARFAPLVCTDSAGGFLGVLHLEDLMAHLADPA